MKLVLEYYEFKFKVPSHAKMLKNEEVSLFLKVDYSTQSTLVGESIDGYRSELIPRTDDSIIGYNAKDQERLAIIFAKMSEMYSFGHDCLFAPKEG